MNVTSEEYPSGKVSLNSAVKDLRQSRMLATERLLRSNPFPAGTTRHVVQFYDRDDFVVATIANLVGRALDSGQSSIVIATPEHRSPLDCRLLMDHSNLQELRDLGRYVSLDAATTLAQFMNGNAIDEARFHPLVGGIIEQAAEKSVNEKLLVFGEMVALLCAAGNFGGVIRLEQLWNHLGRKYEFCLICAYPLSSFADSHDANDLIRVCAEHTLAIPAEGPL
jgi:hypothetical protein